MWFNEKKKTFIIALFQPRSKSLIKSLIDFKSIKKSIIKKNAAYYKRNRRDTKTLKFDVITQCDF